jgi:RTX calcium-binding nonapeptide repeat (4 copies)
MEHTFSGTARSIPVQGHWWRSRLCRKLALGGLAAVPLWLSANAAHAELGVKPVTARIKNNVLTVAGSSSGDAITIRLKAGDPNTLEVDVGANGTADFQFNRQLFTAIDAAGNDGDDTIVADPVNGSFTDTERTTLSGGRGNDRIFGANGDERLDGGGGDDFVDGNVGVDSVVLGAGVDVFQWDPGDGSDVVDGGLDRDQVVFNGSAASEGFGLVNVAGHVRLSRDVAGISADFDNVEALTINAFGGADTITVNDLTGTEMTDIDTNLAASGGAPDGIADEVIVDGTPADDQISVVDDGPAVLVQGLSADVRVTGSDPTLDRLTVMGLEGNDVITASPASGALILLNIVD